jgi:hypothetical protein
VPRSAGEEADGYWGVVPRALIHSLAAELLWAHHRSAHREETAVIVVGVGWAEDYHDICVMDEAGDVLGKRRIADNVEGMSELHELVGAYAEEPEEVTVGIEVDRGLIVTALLGAGYAVNPMASSRYRDRHWTDLYTWPCQRRGCSRGCRHR